MDSNIVQLVVILAVVTVTCVSIITITFGGHLDKFDAIVVQIMALAGGTVTGLLAYLRSLQTEKKVSPKGGIDPEFREAVKQVMKDEEQNGKL